MTHQGMPESKALSAARRVAKNELGKNALCGRARRNGRKPEYVVLKEKKGKQPKIWGWVVFYTHPTISIGVPDKEGETAFVL